ncbi:hypothetical protein GC197_08010 [bacterium]|nr:hypothetical protein [bacterium]
MMPQMRTQAQWLTLWIVVCSCWLPAACADEPEVRSSAHQKFAEDFWSYLKDKYTTWKQPGSYPAGTPLPEAGEEGTIYLNNTATESDGELPYGSIIVVQHQRDGQPSGISALFHSHPGVNSKKDDWYEVFYLADGTPVKTSGDREKYDRSGFVTRLIDGRLWVLPLDSPDVPALLSGEGPEKHVTLPGAGPDRKTLKSDSRQTALAYLFTELGFVTFWEDGRAWVFVKGSTAAKEFAEHGFPEKHVTRIGAGPMRTTIKAPDAETIDQFLSHTSK